MLKDSLDQHLDLVEETRMAEVEEAIDGFTYRHNFDSPN